jgi:hypothetical protein
MATRIGFIGAGLTMFEVVSAGGATWTPPSPGFLRDFSLGDGGEDGELACQVGVVTGVAGRAWFEGYGSGQ